MIRKFFLIFILVFLFLGVSDSLLSEYKKPRFYIKLKGYASFSSGGDFGDFVERNDLYFNELNSTSDSHDISITKRSFFQGFGGEIGIEVKKHAVGISIGYISQDFNIDYHYEADNSDLVENYVRKYTFSAIPIFIFIHYKIINRRYIKAFLTLGEGVYLATYKDDMAVTYEENIDLTFANSHMESRKNHLGFHVGTSIDLNISKNLAVFIDAGYRLVSFKEMEAEIFYEDDNQESSFEDSLYYRTNRRTGEARFAVGESGGVFWEELPAKFNLNGFSFSLGVKIIF